MIGGRCLFLEPAELVLENIQILDEEGKRFSFDHDWHPDDVANETPVVNRMYSRYLNGATKDAEWSILEDGMIYHKFRGAYFRACLANADVDPFDCLSYARSILGDKDEATIKAYQ